MRTCVQTCLRPNLNFDSFVSDILVKSKQYAHVSEQEWVKPFVSNYPRTNKSDDPHLPVVMNEKTTNYQSCFVTVDIQGTPGLYHQLYRTSNLLRQRDHNVPLVMFTAFISNDRGKMLFEYRPHSPAEFPQFKPLRGFHDCRRFFSCFQTEKMS